MHNTLRHNQSYSKTSRQKSSPSNHRKSTFAEDYASLRKTLNSLRLTSQQYLSPFNKSPIHRPVSRNFSLRSSISPSRKSHYRLTSKKITNDDSESSSGESDTSSFSSEESSVTDENCDPPSPLSHSINTSGFNGKTDKLKGKLQTMKTIVIPTSMPSESLDISIKKSVSHTETPTLHSSSSPSHLFGSTNPSVVTSIMPIYTPSDDYQVSRQQLEREYAKQAYKRDCEHRRRKSEKYEENEEEMHWKRNKYCPTCHRPTTHRERKRDDEMEYFHPKESSPKESRFYLPSEKRFDEKKKYERILAEKEEEVRKDEQLIEEAASSYQRALHSFSVL
ncbi:uncharacterized protein MONOS_5283 [Monocercomonoides exilis]|uniref:uncharacterized protein n=1 Tax=Monocercomonoides exilis TaxID=2049356 RepID=UPI00355A21A8|nr:hypothetical protein MONOS_5283 [Monocercomonoides exilis]|eukprot:MONOS_5283.1-p1 / transcript=MONOS_5283.1 / gene=MONOS_5283 / organism=Monocercomonoides_exilis_PA203 / gene_product=unspecified product / transcript_product=unspecified product / location=Mono_scaffold00152:19871-20875(-) / protein_length=335 / sequence_SO=supercontig / SO=protein_coding / is_pseudo=false